MHEAVDNCPPKMCLAEHARRMEGGWKAISNSLASRDSCLWYYRTHEQPQLQFHSVVHHSDDTRAEGSVSDFARFSPAPLLIPTSTPRCRQHDRLPKSNASCAKATGPAQTSVSHRPCCDCCGSAAACLASRHANMQMPHYLDCSMLPHMQMQRPATCNPTPNVLV